ncbi:PREDICTED: telomeric repeat-binding factor 2, partial [Buceros rhinoceros silvestris]|uniref:telomeric repeat-binding factor 2 n=1 Tax=Buceros rhinoceros silvestris TaxID=175836 RepID=UPI00052842D7
MQLLSRIEEGENLDCTFDKESELTPLESAIGVLELIQEEFSVPESRMEMVQKMVTEAAVIVCIKNREFEKASKIVKRHLGKEPKSQKKRSELLAVIRERNVTHPVVKSFSYKSFQQRVLQFLKSYVDDSEPLLLTIMKKTLNSQHAREQNHPSVTPEPADGSKAQAVAAEPSGSAQEPAGAPEPTEAADEQPSEPAAAYGISVLREAFKILSDSPDADALFTKLDETDFSFPKQLSPSVSHRTKRRKEEENQDSEISDPLEISHKGKRLLTISKLVAEQDSQYSESSESPDSSQEPVVSSASRPVQKPHDQPAATESAEHDARPLRSFQRRWNSSYGKEEKDSWSEEDELFLDAASPATNSHNSTVFGSKKQ